MLTASLAFESASRIAELIRAKKVTSTEVCSLLVERINTINSKVNAIVAWDEKQVMEAAKQADQQLAAGIIKGPLHGVPITLKDTFAVQGLPATSGYVPLREYVPDFDSTVAQRLKLAGAIIVGKTNVSTLLIDFQTVNEIYGRTSNPWDIHRTSGGSSGGSAAAIAAGLSYLEVGSDIGGSLRLPAHFCGVYSLKATEHAISWNGHMPGFSRKSDYDAMRSLVSLGPIARTIDDLRLCYRVIAGSEPHNPHVPVIRAPEPKRSDHPLKIAWLEEIPGFPVSLEIRLSLRNYIQQLNQAGIETVKLDALPFDISSAHQLWGQIMDAQSNSYTPAWRRALQYWVTQKLSFSKSNPAMLFPLSFKNYLRALTRREHCITQLEACLEQVDVLLMPVCSTHAYPHINGKKRGVRPVYDDPLFIDGVPLNYWIANGAYTNIFNLTGSPVVTMPIGQASDGLPIGIQCVGRRWRDWELMDAVERLPQVTLGIPNL